MSNIIPHKVLIVGDGCYEIYDLAFEKSFRDLGWEVDTFYYWKYTTADGYMSLLKKIEDRYIAGPDIRRLNRDLIEKAKGFEPDLIFLYRCRNIRARTIKKLKGITHLLFSYNNDNPFSECYPRYWWRNYKASIKFDDITYIYRESNREQSLKTGSKKQSLLRSYYRSDINFYIKDLKKDTDDGFPEVVFIGHYEEDERKDYITYLLEAGIKIGVPEVWRERIRGYKNLVFLPDSTKKYNEYLNRAKIALCFFSKINNDTYTRRVFEITAVKTLLLCAYTDEMTFLFEPDKEAVYFSSSEELKEKIQYYLNHPIERDIIASKGYERLMKDGHEVHDRVKKIIEDYDELA